MATTTTAIPANTTGRSQVEYAGGRRALIFPVTFVFSASYPTGGEPLALPADVTGRELKAVVLLNPLDGTRIYQWDGSTTTPKIQAFTGLTAEVANATNLSAVAARRAWLVYAA